MSNTLPYRSDDHTIFAGRRRFLSGATAFLVAGLLSVNSHQQYAFQSTGMDLGEVHDSVYHEFIAQQEKILSEQRVRVSGFYGRILREGETGKYTLEYVVTTQTLIGEEIPHRHIELVSTVWREKGLGKAKAQQEQQGKWQHFSRNFSQQYPNSSPTVFSHQSGDTDLYQIAQVVVW